MFPSDYDFDAKVTLENQANAIDEDLPFRLLILGDWSGRESRDLDSQTPRSKPIEIDRDNFDDVMKKLRVSVDLDFQGEGGNILSLEFAELDDFHPDRIFQRLPLFTNLRDIRKKLLKPETFDEAAHEVNSWLNTNQDVAITENILSDQSAFDSDLLSENLLDQILEQSDANDQEFITQNSENKELSGFISKIVKPHLIQTDSAEQSKLLLIVDEVISDLMRNILHHSQFQNLEAAWRGAYFLVRRIETNANLKIYLLDISKSELTDDLKSSDDLTETFLFQTIKAGISGQTFSIEPWSIFCGNYTFSLGIDDVAGLIRLAKIADNANTPFLSHIEPEMFDFKAFSNVRNSESWKIDENSKENKLWVTLRSLPEAKYLGLAVPRFLARLPYGEQTEPTENFYFEEILDSTEHKNYLWTNPVFACSLLLAQTYSEYAWDILGNLTIDIDDLPFHTYRENDETKVLSCSEIQLSVEKFEQLSDQGLMPFVSFRNTDRIRLGRFQSIATPSATLSGRWK